LSDGADRFVSDYGWTLYGGERDDGRTKINTTIGHDEHGRIVLVQCVDLSHGSYQWSTIGHPQCTKCRYDRIYWCSDTTIGYSIRFAALLLFFFLSGVAAYDGCGRVRNHGVTVGDDVGRQTALIHHCFTIIDDENGRTDGRTPLYMYLHAHEEGDEEALPRRSAIGLHRPAASATLRPQQGRLLYSFFFHLVFRLIILHSNRHHHHHHLAFNSRASFLQLRQERRRMTKAVGDFWSGRWILTTCTVRV
jgi:hypothetical protein